MPTRKPPTASLRSSRWRQAPQSADSARSPLRDLTVASSSARCLQASYGRDRSWSVLVGLEPAGVLGVLVALGRPAAAWRLPAPRRALAGGEVVVALWAGDLQLLGQVRAVIPAARLPAGVGSEVIVAAGASPVHQRWWFRSRPLTKDSHGRPPRLDHTRRSAGRCHVVRDREGSSAQVEVADLDDIGAEAAPHQREDLAGHVLGLIAAAWAFEIGRAH